MAVTLLVLVIHSLHFTFISLLVVSLSILLRHVLPELILHVAVGHLTSCVGLWRLGAILVALHVHLATLVATRCHPTHIWPSTHSLVMLFLQVLLLLEVLLLEHLLVNWHIHILLLEHKQLLLLCIVEHVDASLLASWWWNTPWEIGQLVELVEVLCTLQ